MGQQPIGFVEGLLNAEDTNFGMALPGPWMLMYGSTSMETALELAGWETPFQAVLKLRKAAVDPVAPSATWLATGTTRSAEDMFNESFDTSATTDALFAQAVIFTNLGSGTVKKTALTRLWTSLKGAGWIVARQRHILQQGASGQILPIGNPFASTGVAGLMFGVTYTGVSGTITSPTPMYRLFKTGNTARPSAWQAGTAGSNVTADIRVNQTLTPTVTSSTLIQSGLKVTTTSTTTGVIDVIVAAKR